MQDSDAVAQAKGTVTNVANTAASTLNSAVASVTSSLPSTTNVQTTAQQAATSITQSVAGLVEQVKQALPESVADYIPTSTASSTSTSTSTGAATHHADMPVTLESRETTSAPLEDSRTERPSGVMKPLIPDASTSQSLPAVGTVAHVSNQPAAQENDFTKPHSTGVFEAAGSLQATNNPELVNAQSDLATRAEVGNI